MKPTTVLVSLLLGGGFAFPSSASSSSWEDDCLSRDDASSIVADFIAILEHTDIDAANATAQNLLAENFVEASDSILTLSGRPVSLKSLGNIQH
jgi:hypothetical protein